MLIDLENYITKHSTPESELLSDLYRETNLYVMNPRMASGHIQGRFLSCISKLMNPRRILEIGTFTGYATLCLAEGLSDKGKITSIEIDDELEHRIRKYINRANMEDKIELLIGDAKKIIPELNETYDIIFIDGDKRDYSTYYKLCKEKLNHKGLMIADNVLWDGKVLEENSKNDKMTQGIQEFNRMVTEDFEMTNFILPMRDGLMIIQRK